MEKKTVLSQQTNSIQKPILY